MRTAGSNLYFLDPADCSVVEVGCPTNLSGLDSTIDQIETTCLSDTARTYEAGLATPGTATFTLSLDPQDPSHVRLLELKKAGTTLQWAFGLSESPGTAPTGAADSDEECVFTLPTSRSWITFEGFVNSYSLDASLNAVYTVNVGVQISGDPDLIPATS